MTKTAATLYITVNSLLSFLLPGFLGVLGSTALYVGETVRDPKSFSWLTLSIYSYIGFVMASIVFFLPFQEMGISETLVHSPGFLIISGVASRRMSELANKVFGLGLKLPDVKKK